MTTITPTNRPAAVFWLAAIAGALAMGGPAMAQTASPFGVGVPEASPSVGGDGPVAAFFTWVAVQQSQFYRELTGAVGAMREDGRAGLVLMGLSFVYGVLHAAGPGHGKAVISSYVLANAESARNGILLSFLSSLMQAVVAVALVVVAAIALGATSLAMTDAARTMEIGSYVLVVMLGAWLTWTRVLRPLAADFGWRPVAAASAGGQGGGALLHEAHGDDGHGRHDHDTHSAGHGDHHHHHHHVHHGGCGCGHRHFPEPRDVAGRLDLAKAWTAIVSVGFRPCTGALIVLVFAMSQGLLWAGIASAFVMALGTGVTVAALATLAVGARASAMRLAGPGSRAGYVIQRGAEAGGALLVLGFGIVLLTAALGFAPPA